MSATVLYMSMSLDGFIAGPNAGPGNGLGDGSERLHEWMRTSDADPESGIPGRPAGVNGQVFDEFMATGAVVAGRGTFEPAAGWGGDHHDGVPIWLLSRRAPGIDVTQWPLVTYVSDIGTAITEAKRAAGEKNVLVHGAATARLALAAGLLEELEIHLLPGLLGQGRRLFETSLPSTSSCSAPESSRARTASPTCITASRAERTLARPFRPSRGRRVQSCFMALRDGTHKLALPAALRAQIGKETGDEITIHLHERILPAPRTKSPR